MTRAVTPPAAEPPAEPEPAAESEPSAEAGATAGPAGYGELLLSTIDRCTAEEGEVLVLWIDDIQWADLPSLQALLYALRRVGHKSLLTLLATDLTNTAGYGFDRQ